MKVAAKLALMFRRKERLYLKLFYFLSLTATWKQRFFFKNIIFNTLSKAQTSNQTYIGTYSFFLTQNLPNFYHKFYHPKTRWFLGCIKPCSWCRMFESILVQLWEKATGFNKFVEFSWEFVHQSRQQRKAAFNQTRTKSKVRGWF